MKTIKEVEEQIAQLKEQIFIQEMGNDMYYTSPLYKHHKDMLNELYAELESMRENSEVYNEEV